MEEFKTAGAVAALVGGYVEGDASVIITDVASIDDACAGHLTFASSPKALKAALSSGASVVIVDEALARGLERGDKSLIVVAQEAQGAFSKVLLQFRPLPTYAPGISDRAEVSDGAQVGAGVTIMSFAVISEGASVGDGTVIFPGVFVGPGASIGSGSTIHPNVSIYDGSIIGDRVIVHAGSVIGSDGFGYISDASGHHKIAQRGIVRIEDDVEIGASVTIDRATVGETLIGRGTKIDNLVQIAHNVKVGEASILVAQVGIAGSTRLGKGVVLGGQAGLVGHIELGDGAMVGAGSGLSCSVPAGEIYSGHPAIPHRTWLRVQPVYKKLPDLKKQVNDLEKRLSVLEEGKEEGDSE